MAHAPPPLLSGVDTNNQPIVYRGWNLTHSTVPVTCVQSGLGTHPTHLNTFFFDGPNLNPRSHNMVNVLHAWVLFWIRQFTGDLSQIMSSAVHRGSGSEIASATFRFKNEGLQRVSLIRGRASSTGYDFHLRHCKFACLHSTWTNSVLVDLYTDNDATGNNTISRIELPYFLWDQTLYVPNHLALIQTPVPPLPTNVPTTLTIDGTFLVSLLTRGVSSGSTLKLSTIQNVHLLPRGTPLAAIDPHTQRAVPIKWYGIIRGSGALSVSLVGWNFSSEVQKVYVQKVGQTRTGWVQEMY